MRLHIGNFPNRLDFEARLAIGGALGFGAISVGGPQLDELVQKYGVGGLKQLLDRHQMSLSRTSGPSYSHEGELWRKMIDESIPRFKVFAELGGKQVGMNAPNRWAKAVTEYEWEWLAGKYREYADLVSEYGLTVMFEFLGHHVGRPRRPSMVTYPWIDNIKTAVQFAERVNRPNVGIVVDVIHWWASGGTLEDLHLVKGLPITVHMFDLPNGVTRETIEDSDRVLPGEGFLDLVTWLKTLKADGYDGDVLPEVLGARAAELAEMDSWEGPKLVRDAYFKVFEQL